MWCLLVFNSLFVMLKLSRKGFIVQLLSHLRTTLTSMFIALAIAACGSSSDAQSPQINDGSPSLIDDSTVIQPVSSEVLGDDIDSDGIRDDVQEYIATTYLDRPIVIRNLSRVAVYDQMLVNSAHDPLELSRLLNDRLLAIDCLIVNFEYISESEIDRSRELDISYENYIQEMFDTKERAELYVALERISSDNGFFIPENNDCS